MSKQTATGRRGRPPLPESARRTHQVSIRLNAKEVECIGEIMKATGKDEASAIYLAIERAERWRLEQEQRRQQVAEAKDRAEQVEVELSASEELAEQVRIIEGATSKIKELQKSLKDEPERGKKHE